MGPACSVLICGGAPCSPAPLSISKHQKIVSGVPYVWQIGIGAACLHTLGRGTVLWGCGLYSGDGTHTPETGPTGRWARLRTAGCASFLRRSLSGPVRMVGRGREGNMGGQIDWEIQVLVQARHVENLGQAGGHKDKDDRYLKWQDWGLKDRGRWGRRRVEDKAQIPGVGGQGLVTRLPNTEESRRGNHCGSRSCWVIGSSHRILLMWVMVHESH